MKQRMGPHMGTAKEVPTKQKRNAKPHVSFTRTAVYCRARVVSKLLEIEFNCRRQTLGPLQNVSAQDLTLLASTKVNLPWQGAKRATMGLLIQCLNIQAQQIPPL